MKNIKEEIGDQPAVNPVVSPDSPERKISVIIQRIMSITSKSLNIFETEMDKLNSRLSTKMSELTSTQDLTVQSNVDLKQQFEKLSEDFGQKSSQVLALNEKLQDLMKSGLVEDKERIQALLASSNELMDKLKKSQEEAKKAAENTANVAAAGAADYHEMSRRVAELQDYGMRAEEHIDKLEKEYMALHREIKKAHKKQAMPGIFDSGINPEQESLNYGGFNLKEHLKRAIKKQGKTETWF